MRRHALLWFALAGCTSVEGELVVEGQPVGLADCKSATPSGFSGVDIELDSGSTLRLLRIGSAPAIEGVAFFDRPTDDLGLVLGACAVGEARDTNTRTNDVVNIEGEAQLDCADPRSVVGEVRFSNCH